MIRRVDIKSASNATGLSEYAIRKGIKEKRYPHIRTGLGTGKILIDIDLLERYLEQEAIDNVGQCQQKLEIINYGQLRRVAE